MCYDDPNSSDPTDAAEITADRVTKMGISFVQVYNTVTN